MKILEIKSIIFPEIKVIKYAHFLDERGFFSEVYRKSDFEKIDFLKNKVFVQCNTSTSKKGVIRGLHLQWNPHIDKLIRVINGSMIDLFLDIRIKSPTFGKIGSYKLTNYENEESNKWIWIPKGFAHGSVFKDKTSIEYFCTAEHSPMTEASIYPLAPDIDWSLVHALAKKELDELLSHKSLISKKDKKGYTLAQWLKEEKSQNFIYDKNRI